MTSIRIPATVQEIGHDAFSHTGLDVVVIDNGSSLTTIGDSVSDLRTSAFRLYMFNCNFTCLHFVSLINYLILIYTGI